MLEETMTPGERALYDARADVEAWDYANEILGSWFEMVHTIDHPELTEAVEVGMDHANTRYREACQKLKRLERES